MSRTTRAAVLREYEAPLTIETMELREPGEEDLVVRIVASGICQTDVSVIHAKLPYPPPVVLGHEGAGIVEEVGARVKGFEVGDHVVLSACAACGQCHYCDAGTLHLCESGVQAAMMGQNMNFRQNGEEVAAFTGLGTFAERVVVRAEAAIKISRDIPLSRACLVGCAVTTGVGAVINTAKVHPGATVAVFGCGGVGLNVIQGAALSGASRIIAVDVVDRKLAWARELGATETLNARGIEESSDEIRALTGGLGVDFAFEAIGSPDVIRQAFFSVKRGGKAVVVGVAGFGVDVSIPACLFSFEERSLMGSLYGSANMARDVPRLLDLYQRGKLKLDELVSREIALDEVNEGVSALEKGEVIRSVIVFDGAAG